MARVLADSMGVTLGQAVMFEKEHSLKRLLIGQYGANKANFLESWLRHTHTP